MLINGVLQDIHGSPEDLHNNAHTTMTEHDSEASDSDAMPTQSQAQWHDVFEDDEQHTARPHPQAAQQIPPTPAPSQPHHDTTSPALPRSDTSSSTPPSPHDIMSADASRARSAHATAGYRDGISAGKAAALQAGFDEGFALGGELGRAAGVVVGGFVGVLAALKGGVAGDGSAGEVGAASEQVAAITRLCAEAVEALSLERVFAREFVDEDGLWRYEVPSENGEDVTFDRVAWAHPLVVTWHAELLLLSQRLGLDLDALKHSMGEADDDDDNTFQMP